MSNVATYLDFFAGSGLVCEGLKDFFVPVWANDICEKKAEVFLANHPSEIFHLGPIEKVKGWHVPVACLSWGSFPCQDLSLAGKIKGISHTRSGLVWHWLRVMDEMKHRPYIAVAENVVGLVSADHGKHYKLLHESLVDRNYKVGSIILDAAYWVPQSRKRVFVIAVKHDLPTKELETDHPTWCHPDSIVHIAQNVRDWIWWKLPEPVFERKRIEEIIDLDAPFVDASKQSHLLFMIPPKHRQQMEDAFQNGYNVFPGYKRVRNGKQVLELRFDGLAGCLRTPGGGSSRQFVVIRKNGSLNIRLLTVKEAALLMGVPSHYKIPGSYNDGYKAMGDAVAVPVTRYLAKYLLHPLAQKFMNA
ncbi:MAG: DNA cytosine methyltransferase [bacterium]